MQQDQPDVQEMLGSQGNEGMYGQGQYDSEGKPDPRGAEAQRLKPDTPQGTNQQQQLAQNDQEERRNQPNPYNPQNQEMSPPQQAPNQQTTL